MTTSDICFVDSQQRHAYAHASSLKPTPSRIITSSIPKRSAGDGLTYFSRTRSKGVENHNKSSKANPSIQQQTNMQIIPSKDQTLLASKLYKTNITNNTNHPFIPKGRDGDGSHHIPLAGGKRLEKSQRLLSQTLIQSKLISNPTINKFYQSALLVAAFVCMSISIFAQCNNQDDYTALRALYLSTDGDNWTDNTGWPDAATFTANPIVPGGTDMSTWYGIRCNLVRVDCIDMDGIPTCFNTVSGGNNLTGSLPPEIGNLIDIEYLTFSFNNLSGSIPPEIGNLNSLMWLYLGYNQFSGSLPSEIGNLVNLKILNLWGNQLNNSIPPELGNLSDLIQLILAHNEFSGEIPSELGNLNNLSFLRVNDNQLSQCFDSNLINLCTIGFLDFSNNPLLPWEGDFSQFCATAGTEAEQYGAPCDDGNPSNDPDIISTSCLCIGCGDLTSTPTVTLDTYFGYTGIVDGTPSGGSGTYTTHAWVDAGTGTSTGVTLTNATSQIVTIDATAATAGTIDLEYTVTDDNGCPYTESIVMNILDPCAGINATTIEVTNTNDSGPGSLRQAIDCVNADATLDNIVFNIPGGGPHIISPLTPLPLVTDPSVSIDGGTLGNIIIDCGNQSTGFGLDIRAANVSLFNIELHSSPSAGFYLTGVHDNLTLQNCNIYNNGAAGIQLVNGNNHTINNCNIYQNNSVGILINSGAQNVIMSNNSIYDNSNGIQSDGSGVILNNIITNNSLSGITLGGTAIFSITQNSINCNSFLGINLTSNANSSQPTPQIDLATTTSIQISNCAAGDIVEVFSNPNNCTDCEGEVYLGDATDNGDGTFTYTGSFSVGDKITCTSTTGMNTSEFSNCAIVCSVPVNDICSGAIVMSDNVIESFDNSCSSEDTNFCGNYADDYSLWYSYTTESSGIGSTVVFRLIPDGDLTFTSLNAYTDCSGTQYVPLNDLCCSTSCNVIDDLEPTIPACEYPSEMWGVLNCVQPNTTLYFETSLDTEDTGTFVVDEISFCESAIDEGILNCGSSINFSFGIGCCITNNIYGCFTSSPGTWHKIEVGSGLTSVILPSFESNVHIYTDDCPNLNLLPGNLAENCTYPAGYTIPVTAGDVIYFNSFEGNIVQIEGICCPSDLGLSCTPLSETCDGADDGEISVTATAGTSPYMYDIGSGNVTTSTFTGLTDGLYTVTVTDDDGCTDTCMATVNAGPSAPSNDVCAGAIDGSLTSPSGGYDFTCATPDPTALCTTGPSLWFEYTNGNTNSLIFTVDALTSGTVGIEVYTVCGDLTSSLYGSCLTGNPMNACVAPNTTYYIQVIAVNGDDFIEFQVSESITLACCPGGAFPSITNPGNQTECDSYTLPAITGTNLSGTESYYDNSQAMGGAAIAQGTMITTTQTVWIYDNNSACEDEESFTVTINSSPIPAIAGDTQICPAGSTMLDAGSYTMYLWSPNGETSQTITANMVGNYTVTVTDANNCTGSSTVTITEYPAMTGAVTNEGPVCEGGTVTLSETISDPNVVGWSWSTTSGATITNPTMASTTATNVSNGDTFLLELSDVNGCTIIPMPTTVTTIDSPTITQTDAVCNDNGTPSDASDDFYDITVNATNTLPGLTDQYIVEDNALNIYGPFTYGIPQMFTMPASGTSDNLVFSDADLPSCQAAQSIGPLVTCSPDCEIVNETITNIQCNDNGTPSNPTDDFITFDLNPSGFNLGLGASYDLDQGLYTTVPTFGTYGTTTTFTTLPGTAGGGDLPGLITDGIDLGCALMFNISDPGSCSMECDLLDAGWDGTSSCNEAGSTNDPTDDFITFTLDPSGFNQGTSYTVSVPSGSISPTTAVYGSGTVFTLQNGSAGLGSIIVTIADGVDPLCSIDVTISDPGPCCSIPPDIVNSGSQVACDLFNLPTITGTNLTGGEAYYNNNQVSGGAQIVGPITSTQTVWIYDGNPTCEDEESFIVTINTSPTAFVPTITVCSNAQANYDLTIHNPSVGIGTITWYDGQPSGAGVLIAPDNAVDLSTITDLWVLLTDGNGCTDEAQVPIQVDTPPLPTISGDTDFCNGQTVAMLTVDQTYAMYAWSNSQPTQAITVNTANTYQVTVTDANGCTGVTSIVVSENTPPTPTITGDNTICEGQETIMLDAGIGYISYDWGSGPSATSSFDVSLAGNYSVTVTDANGCTGEDAFVVSANTVTPPNITGSLTYCVGSSTVLDAGVYTGYTWSPNGETSQSITVSSPGNYEVTVTDVNGCTSSSMVSVSEDPNLSIVIGGSTMYCPGEATILDAGGGFTLYSWSTGGLGQFESINSSGVVSVTVTDVTGCTGSSTVTISESIVTMPDLDYTDFCDGDMSSITVVNGPFADYLWSDASNGSTLDVSINGNYSLTVTDANGCTSESSIAVTAFTNPSPSITGLATVCPGGSGSTTLGTANTYTSYQWSTSAVSPFIVITSAGNYSVTVTDANGCTGLSTIPVTEFTSPTVNISGSTSYCPGSVTTLDAGGGFASYLWSPNGETTPTISVSNVGTVAVTVTDVNGCTASSAVNVTEDASLNPSITGSAIFCQGESTVLDAGAGFVNYQWSTTETSQSITVSSAGIYEVTVSDAGGCTGTSMLTVTEAIPIVPTMSNTQYCIGESTIISMTPTYSSYVWDDASIGPTIIVSADGTYGVTVTDNNGCTASSMLMVNADTPPSPTISGVLGLCPGGMTTVDAGAGYTDYAWSPSGSGQMQGVTAAGNYTVTVTDANGCTGESSVVVNQNLAPAAVISGSTSYCPGLSTTLDAGVGFVGYAWSPNGETTQTISVATANTYTVTVTDANGCTSSSLVSVTEQSSLSPTIIGSAVFCQGESTVLDAGAGFANYQWSTTETSQSITVSSAKIYEVTVSDAGGCTGTSMLTVTENPELTLDVLTVVGVTDCDNPNGEVFLQASGGSPMYTFTWLPDLTNANTLLNADIGTYVITVTDQLGCTASSTAIVMDEGGCGCLNAATLPMPTVCNDDLNNFNFADFISSDADDGTWTLLDIGTGDNTTIVVTPSIISIDDTTLPGTYVFEYCTTIQSGGSCVECSQQTLTVVSSPIATLIQTNVQACNAMPQGGSGQSNILDITSYLDSNSDFGTWSDNAGLLLGGQPISAVDFTGLTIGTEVIFTYQTTTGAGLCPEVSVELTVLIIDCQCPVITLDPLPNVCNSGEILDLNQYSGGSDPGSWTIQDITGDLSTLQFDDLANTISIDMATVPGDYQVTYTLDNAAVGCPESQVAVFTVVASPATVTFAEAFACNEVNVTGSALSNVLDLTSYILSGSTTGTWTSPLVGLDLSDPTAVDFTGLMTSSPITLTYTTADAILPCQDEAYEFIVTIVDCTCPDISLDPLPQVCNDGQVVYLSNSETVDTDPGSWSFISGPSNVNLIGDSLSTDALIAGVYTFEFTLDILPPSGCLASNSLLLDVTQTANSGTPDNLGTYCQGEETILDLNDLLIGEDIGGEWTDVSASPAASFDGLTGQFDISVQASGTYEFMYVVTGVSPCADAMTPIEVVIEPAIIADVGLGGALDCITSELQLGGGLTSSGPNYTYQWIGPASSALGTESELVVQDVGTYQLVVTDLITGCSTAESITITAGSNTTIAQDTVIALCSEEVFMICDTIYQAMDIPQVVTCVDPNGVCQTEYAIDATIFTSPMLDDQLYVFTEFQQTVDILVNSNAAILERDSLSIIENEDFSYTISDDGQININLVEGFTGTTVFEAILCNLDCIECDTANISILKKRSEFTEAVLTPNGDGQNETFIIDGYNENLADEYPQNNITIFNRWGQVVFTKDGYDNDWTGDYQDRTGQPLPEGTYYFELFLGAGRSDEAGQQISVFGSITILR